MKKLNEKGMILGMALIFMIISVLMGYGLINLSAVDAIEVIKAVQITQAFWTAEAGLEYIKAIGQKNRIPFEDFLNINNPITGPLGNSNYSVTIVADPGNPGRAIKNYTITSTGNQAAFSQLVIVDAQIQTYASYMFATNFENGIYFTTGETMNGPVYTNDYLNIFYNPVFEGSVKSAQDSIHYAHGGPPVDSPDFQQGYELGVVPLDFEEIFSSLSIETIKNAAENGGLKLNGNYNIEFLPDGTITYQRQGQPAQTADLSALNGAIYVENGNVTVSGVVNGKVTILSDNNIEIDDDIVYASPHNAMDVFRDDFDPEDIQDSLGLIARRNVEVDKPYSVTDPGIIVHAGIMAMEGSFYAADYSNRPRGGYLNLYGGITQYSRGIVGYIGRSGYLKNYKYNENFLKTPPPFFPYSVYKVANWRQ
jgi:hypothetical protein